MKSVDLTRFDLNLLVVMDALLAERHVGRAAVRLHLSQSATSHALSRLRTALDDPLFIRNPKGIEPTPLAMALGPKITALLEQIRGITSPRGPFEPGALTRKFTIGATDYAVMTVLTPAISMVQAAAPGVVLQIVPTDRESVAHRLDTGEMDLAIGSGSFTAVPQRFDIVPLFEERFVGIARRDHPCLRKRGKRVSMNLGEFVELPHALVSPKGDTRGAIDVALQKIGRMRKVVVTCPNFLAVPFLVGSSDVIAVIAERAAIRLADAAGLSLFELPIQTPGWSVYIGRARGRAAEPEIAWLTNVIAAAARS